MAALKHYSSNAPKSVSDIALFEVDQRWSREDGELAPLAEALPMGAVLVQNKDGQYIPYGQGLSEPAEATEDSGAEASPTTQEPESLAILISRDIEPSDEPQNCVVIRRGACVAAANLFWLPTVTDDQKKNSLAALASLGIIPKE